MVDKRLTKMASEITFRIGPEKPIIVGLLLSNWKHFCNITKEKNDYRNSSVAEVYNLFEVFFSPVH